jgi:hypothetical protein
LRAYFGLFRCFCGRWRFLHTGDQIAQCDWVPLPLQITEAGWERLAEIERSGIVPTDATAEVYGDGDDARSA